MSSLSPRQPISAPRYAAPLRLGLALLASLVGETRSGFAQDIRDEVYVTDGTVVAVAQAGGTIYIGGNFSYVGPSTGSAVPIDAATGAALGLPKVAGTTYAVAPDGSGGWYVGGIFTHVAGIPRSNIAHIQADHTVSAWNPGANDQVAALLVSGGTVYVGGTFNTIGGQTRSRIAALDAVTGSATAWNPNCNGMVSTLGAASP